MIVLNNVVEPAVGEATGTYPALIVNEPYTKTETDSTVYDSPTTEVYLQVYCPATMFSGPEAAKSAINNVIVAPYYKDDSNKTKYDYQIGGVVLISYADGNLNSPLFVRYVSVDKSIVKTNKSYIEGNEPIIEQIFNINTEGLRLGDPILVKVKELLSTVQVFAKGEENDSYTSINHSNIDGFEYRKCGRYGVEFINQCDSDFV